VNFVRSRAAREAPFFRLEAEGLECTLADAKQVKHLPGRPKTDTAVYTDLGADYYETASTTAARPPITSAPCSAWATWSPSSPLTEKPLDALITN
jgi:hypothetical protein